jgi:hypothetical protein
MSNHCGTSLARGFSPKFLFVTFGKTSLPRWSFFISVGIIWVCFKWIESAKRPETRVARITEMMALLKAGKKQK